MKKRTKTIVIVVIGVTCFSLFFLIYFGLVPSVPSPFDTPPINEQQQEVSNITLIIDFNGAKTNKTLENLKFNNSETTVFDALKTYCELGWIDYPNGAVFVNEIDGVKNNVNIPNHFWIYRVNGEQPNVGCSKYNLLDNSIIVWEYAEYGS